MYFPPGHRLPAKYGLGAAALRYAALGYAVIPLVRGGKRPHQMLGNVGGVHLASKDPTQIAEWWSLDMAANIGVATGKKDSHLVVIDLDVKGGVNGKSSFARYLRENSLPFPGDVPYVETPSGGRHLWLRPATGPRYGNETDPSDRIGILPGVDVRGKGGLIVAPPSGRMVMPITRPGERSGSEIPVPYSWGSGCPHAVPDAPPWLDDWLKHAPSSRLAADGKPNGEGEQVPLDDAIGKSKVEGLPDQRRNQEMYRIVCGLFRRFGTVPSGTQQVLDTAREIYAATDKTDFPWSEVLVCVESARRFVERSKGREDARNAEFLGWLERRHYRS